MQAAPAAPDSASKGGCPTCASGGCSARLKRIGLDASNADHVIALLGNPNTGKSTVFNALTGLRQHVGNWTGKTVARAEGAFDYAGRRYRLVDLPGAYSLFSSSHHEEIPRDFLLFGQPDVTVVVVDATRLERNLILVLQTLEITDRVVVALNLMDEARRHGIEIDARALSRRLGVPVVPMAARRGEGLAELLAAIDELVAGRFVPSVSAIEEQDPALSAAITDLTALLAQQYPGLPNLRWVAMRLLDNDESIVQAVREGTLGDLQRMEARALPGLRPEELPQAG